MRFNVSVVQRLFESMVYLELST